VAARRTGRQAAAGQIHTGRRQPARGAAVAHSANVRRARRARRLKLRPARAARSPASLILPGPQVSTRDTAGTWQVHGRSIGCAPTPTKTATHVRRAIKSTRSSRARCSVTPGGGPTAPPAVRARRHHYPRTSQLAARLPGTRLTRLTSVRAGTAKSPCANRDGCGSPGWLGTGAPRGLPGGRLRQKDLVSAQRTRSWAATAHPAVALA
jgi:hypothetical protein